MLPVTVNTAADVLDELEDFSRESLSLSLSLSLSVCVCVDFSGRYRKTSEKPRNTVMYNKQANFNSADQAVTG